MLWPFWNNDVKSFEDGSLNSHYPIFFDRIVDDLLPEQCVLMKAFAFNYILREVLKFSFERGWLTSH